MDIERIKGNIEENASHPIPKWLDLDRENAQAKVIDFAKRDDIDLEITRPLSLSSIPSNICVAWVCILPLYRIWRM
jgi:hypothetical protein